MVFLNKTFCASPNCTNKCGKKMTPKEIALQKKIWADTGRTEEVSYAYFCGEPEDKNDKSKPTI